MILFLDSDAEDEMVLYRDAGICTSGYYAGSDGLTDPQSCFEQCIAEAQCLYVSFMAGKTCSRFKNYNCKIRVSVANSNDKLYITYKKVKKGGFTIFKFDFVTKEKCFT